MTNFSQLTSTEFNRIMRLHGDYMTFALKHMLIEARNGNVVPSVKAAFSDYEKKRQALVRSSGVGAASPTHLREKAAEKGKETYQGMPCMKCDNTLRLTTNGCCVACSKDKKKAMNDTLRKEIVGFIELHGIERIQRVHPCGAERMATASKPDSDLSCLKLRTELRKNMKAAAARLAAMESRV